MPRPPKLEPAVLCRGGALLISALLLGCGRSDVEHGHSHAHGGGHSHAHGGGHAHGSARSSGMSFTRWTSTHELFVELDGLSPAAAVGYTVYVTRLDDHRPVPGGRLALRFDQDGFAVESHAADAADRAGVFTFQAPAPAKAGTYDLVFTYVHGEERAEWTVAGIPVGEGALPAGDQGDGGAISFAKSAQWQVPFRVTPARQVAMGTTITAGAMVHPAPENTVIVAAPREGMLAWADALPVVGRQVRRGERLATLIPAGAAERWARLQADLADARVDCDLADADLRRAAESGGEDLLAARRQDEAQAAHARACAQVTAAEQRMSAFTSGGAGAVSVQSPTDGVLVGVGAPHGEAVASGTPLIRVATGAGVMLQARVHQRDVVQLSPVVSAAVWRGDAAAPVDLLAVGARVLTERLIFDPETLSAPITVVVDQDVGLVPGELVSLELGVGAPTAQLAVPRSAILESNGQDVVFVQESGASFSRRRVTLGPRDATHVAVLSGLSEGERVVEEGGFDVHVASLTGALESHRH